MSHPVSPLAPKQQPALPPIAGVRLATAQAGIRYRGRTDVLLVLLDPGTRAAGVFTRSKCPSAAVDWCRETLRAGHSARHWWSIPAMQRLHRLKGRESVRLTAEIAGKAADCGRARSFIASTGVIGEPLDATKFDGVLADCAAAPARMPSGGPRAASAIMTTDTFPKLATRRCGSAGST